MGSQVAFAYLVVLISTCLAADDYPHLRERATATSIWSRSSFPSTNDPGHILDVFPHVRREWGKDSMSTSTQHSASPALRIFYPRGSHNGMHKHYGSGFHSQPDIEDKPNAMILKYDVYFENFGFGLGGKLPGLFGGSSHDKYECLSGDNQDDCFSLRLWWGANGVGEIYAYMPDNQKPGFEDNSEDIILTEFAKSLGRGGFHFENNKWNHVTQEVHLNEVGHTDGWVRVCVEVEGKSPECYTAVNLNLRNTDNINVRGMLFSTYFGGNGDIYGAPNDCYTYFKNFDILVPPHTPIVVALG